MSVIKLEHLETFLKSKQKKGVYGSVLIQIQDGKFKQVNFNETFNSDGFIQHVDNLLKRVTRYVVKNNRILHVESDHENVAESGNTSTSVENDDKNDVKCDKKTDNIDQNKAGVETVSIPVKEE